MALRIPHPYTLPVPLSEPCTFVFQGQKRLGMSVNDMREEVQHILVQLEKLTSKDSLSVLHLLHPFVQPIAQPRNCAFMRELGWTTRSPDLNFIPHYLFGFDTVGWAMHSPSAVPRVSPPGRRRLCAVTMRSRWPAPEDDAGRLVCQPADP